jgi:hypothetical protein
MLNSQLNAENMKRIFLLLSLVIVSVSCTSDPMKGGFFFDEGAAYKRLDEKRSYLQELQSDQAALRRSQ